MAETSSAIMLTDRAARRIAELLEREATPNKKLRIAVSGGGCSGFQYGFDLDDAEHEGDVVIQSDGALVVIDSISLMYLAGSELDYVVALAGAHFTMSNPNATSACSCGSSFAVA